MPTGYTAAIADGITFEQYAMSCARAFGALIMMRDEPADAPIPEQFAPSSYNVEALEKAKARRSMLRTLTHEQVHAEATREFQAALTYYDKRLAECRDLRAKYDAMLASVQAWKAPTPDHEELRKFMLSQILESIPFDCDEKYITPPEMKSTDGWLSIEEAKAARDIAYHEKAHAEEVERTNSRTAWVQALRASLKPA
jgi:hypothetical protein